MKKNVAWSIRKYRQHEANFTELRLFHYDVRPTQDLIAGCIDNKDGYQMPPADLEDLRLRYEALLAKGFLQIVDPSLYLPRVTITWLHAYGAAGYCEADVNVGEHYDEIKRNLPLLDRLVHTLGGYHYKVLEPGTIIPALKKREVVFVQRVPFDRYGYRYCFPVKK